MRSKYTFVRINDEECTISDAPNRTMIRYDCTIHDNSKVPPDWTMCLKDGVWYIVTKDGTVSSIASGHMDILKKVLRDDDLCTIIESNK
jgi:hypothetical protein